MQGQRGRQGVALRVASRIHNYLGLVEGVRRMRRRRKTLFDVVVLVMIFLALKWAYLLPGRALPYEFFTDVLKLTKPVMTFSGEALVDGELPLWNPYYYTGLPNHAMACAGVLYPTTPLYGVLSFSRAFTLDGLLHVFLAGVFTYALCRQAGSGRGAAVTVGAATFSTKIFWAMPPLITYVSYPMTLSSLGHIWSLRMLAWTPLVLLCILRLLNRPRLQDALGLAALTTMQILAGDLQLFVCQWYVTGLILAVELSRRFIMQPAARRRLLHSAVYACGALALALAIGAVQWVPAMELLGQSTRQDGASLEYIRVWGEGKTLEEGILNVSLVLALVPMAMLFLTGLVSRREPMRATFLTVTAAAVFLAVWPDTPLAAFVHRIPIIGQAREPLRVLHPAVFLVLLVAGRQLGRLLRGESGGRGNVFAWIAAAGVAIAAWARIQHRAPVGAIALSLLVLGAVMVAVRANRPQAARRAALALLALLILYDVYRINAWTTKPMHAFQYAAHRDVAQFLEDYEGTERVAVIDEDYHKGLAAAGSDIGVRTLGGGHSLLLAAPAELFAGVTGAPLVEHNAAGELVRDYYDVFSMPEWLTPRALPVLDLFSVRYLLFKSEIPQWMQEQPERFVRMEAGRLVALENTRALPAAFVVHETRAAQNMEAIVAALSDPAFDYHHTALVPPDFDPAALAPATGDERVAVLHYGRNTVELEVDLTAPGLVVFTDAAYPGWTVSIDGAAPTEPILAYGAFKGVVVPEGKHEVAFTFHAGQTWLAPVSGISAFFLLLLLCLKSAVQRCSGRCCTEAE